jgi:phage shock protein A
MHAARVGQVEQQVTTLRKKLESAESELRKVHQKHSVLATKAEEVRVTIFG